MCDSGLPGYDSWKLSYPPEWDKGEEQPNGWEDEDDAPMTHIPTTRTASERGD